MLKTTKTKTGVDFNVYFKQIGDNLRILLVMACCFESRR